MNNYEFEILLAFFIYFYSGPLKIFATRKICPRKFHCKSLSSFQWQPPLKWKPKKVVNTYVSTIYLPNILLSTIIHIWQERHGCTLWRGSVSRFISTMASSWEIVSKMLNKIRRFASPPPESSSHITAAT